MWTDLEERLDKAMKQSKRLTPTMRAHLLYGIAGATWRTLKALERRGLVVESKERPGFLVLSRKGQEMADALRKEDA